MKNHFRRIIAMALIVTCLFSISILTSAAEATASPLPTEVTYSFPANNTLGYSTKKAIPGKQTPYAYITAVNFVGIPSGIWPVGAHIKSAFFSGTTKKSAYADFSAINQPRSSEMSGSYTNEYRFGSKTTSEKGCTITQFWY